MHEMIFNFVNRVWEGFVFVIGNNCGEIEFALNYWKIGVIFGVTLC